MEDRLGADKGIEFCIKSSISSKVLITVHCLPDSFVHLLTIFVTTCTLKPSFLPIPAMYLVTHELLCYRQ